MSQYNLTEPSEIDLQEPWWLAKRDRLLEIGNEYRNAYVYDIDSIRSAARGKSGWKQIQKMEAIDATCTGRPVSCF